MNTAIRSCTLLQELAKVAGDTTPQHIGAIHEAVASQVPRAVFYKEAA